MKKLRLVLLFALLGTTGCLMAQYPSWNKEKKGEFMIDKDYTLTASITLTGNLTLHVADNGGRGYTIKRGSSYEGDLFNISGTSNSKVYKLTIIGTAQDTIYIDGGAVYNTPGDARSGYVSGKRGRAFDVGDWGALDLQYVAVQNFYNTTASQGAAIYADNNQSKLCPLNLTNCVFRGNLSKYQACVLHVDDQGRFQAHMKACRVYHNCSLQGQAEGGIIRSEGGGATIMEIDSCDICYNYTYWCGGGISWYGGGAQDAKITITHNTKVHHNEAGQKGGGVYLGATAVIESAEIYENVAGQMGGGVDMHTYGGPLRAYTGKGLRMTVDKNVSIHDNHAKGGGGGLAVRLYPSRFLGFNSNDNPINVDSAKCIIKILPGAKIYNNTAAYGGGIYVIDELPYRFQNPVANSSGEYRWSKELRREFTMEGGSVYNNYAETTETANTYFYGGGVYLEKIPKDGVSYSTSSSGAKGAGTLVVNLTGGDIYDNKAMSNNGNGYGGGICVHDAFTKYNSNVKVTIGGTVNVYQNKCDKDGGGMYIKSDKTSGSGVLTVKVNGGTIGGTSLAKGNKALGGNGGGIAVASGNLIVDGGTINYNEAKANGTGTGNGGAFSVEGGYAVISGGTVSHNKAEANGGGFYLDAAGGVTDTIKEGAILSYNQALNGAGIYVGQGSIYINGESGANDYTANFESGTFGQMDFVTDEESFPWTVTNELAHGGTYSIKSGNAGEHNSTSTLSLSLMFVEDGTVSFWGNCQGEGTSTFWDHCDFSIDGEVKATHGADLSGWNHYSYPVSAGTHTFVWSYIKDSSVNPTGDAYYVDDIEFTGAGSVINIHNNTATNDGGGLYAGGGNVSILGNVFINNNSARDGGGGYITKSGSVVPTLTFNGSGTGIEVNGNSASYGSTAYGNGGGFYVGNGNVSLTGICKVNGNTASDDGGGFYTTGGTVTLNGSDCVISGNTAEWWGGGIRAGGNISIQDGNIHSNLAKRRGGGVYVTGGTFTMDGGTIGGTTTQGNSTNSLGYGGGLYMASGTATITGGSISGNDSPNGYGGGVYMSSGTCTLSNGAVVGGVHDSINNISYANTARFGAGICSSGGTITVRGGKIQFNKADLSGGGIFSDGTDAVVNMVKQTSKAEALSYIEYNQAHYGGGIYANKGVVNFSDGFIQYNYASEAGGGIYVNDDGQYYGTLNLKGSANLHKNHVPEGHNGGGVYLLGKVKVGGPDNTGVIKAQDNYAGDQYEYFWYNTGQPETDSIDQLYANNRNNIYLPHPENPEVLTNHRDIIEVLEDSLSLSSRVGFSVPHNYVPVIYCEPSSTSHAYLNQFSTGHEYQYMVFDDTRHYVAVHYSDKPFLFDPDHVYLYGFWSNVVTGKPTDLECPMDPTAWEGRDTIEISTPCDLAFFISWVNGLNGLDAHPGANAKLLEDIDMSKYGWVPIGHLTEGYQGIFNGNGHTVTGISSLLYREYLDYGFFGRLNGGTVKDLYVKGSVYALEDKDGIIIGGLAAETSGGDVVSNCEVQSTIIGEHPNTIMGGVIGRSGVEPYTACDGSETNEYAPIYGYWADAYQKCEYIIPATELAGMSGSELIGLRFYIDSPAEGGSNDGSWGNAKFKVFLREVSNTTISDYTGYDDDEVLFEGSLSGKSSSIFVNFSKPFTYNGGNLLVGVYETTKGSYSNHTPTFFGIEASGACVYGYNSSSISSVSANQLDFIPQTTFFGVPSGSVEPLVHSSIGIADMTGYTMGGLVGVNKKGNFYNSFANSRFTMADDTHTKYMGGLIAVNEGTLENCYARLRGDAPEGSFGILVGDNTKGTVNFCYAPDNMNTYTVADKEGELNGHGNYAETHLPYLYKHRDTKVTATNTYVSTDATADNQMMNVLNNWVKAQNGSTSTYTEWSRPWQESDAQKPLNDDYPILLMPKCEAVGAKNGDPYLHYNKVVDTLLAKYTASGEAIWLYRSPTDTVWSKNLNSQSKLYIDENVVLINMDTLKAYVGITLDNSAGTNGVHPTYGSFVGVTTDATDWHIISSPLSNARIGINYSDGDAYEYSEGHPNNMPYYRFYPKSDDKHGYFPSMEYSWAANNGFVYNASDAAPADNGNYYREWDFYSYYEPEYHWINFKRNSASHHHFDHQDHETINYMHWDATVGESGAMVAGNESKMIAGKGYFAATREETFLQCYGMLNANEDLPGYKITHTPGVPRHGYNLLGNPYQAYLDFDAFAEDNTGDDVDGIWDNLADASYTVLDEDARSYLTFSYDGSDNPDAAGRFIHPHQGFFVLLRDRDEAMAYFNAEQRNVTAKNVTFRGEHHHLNYPLVNLFVSEADGNSDMVTVELGRPDVGGALLMQGLRAGNGKIWCHYNDEDYAIAYTQPGVTEVAIRFETAEDTEYTMRWNTHNGEFSYMHLIDNLTGADVDCLSASEYRFSASTSDYKSRFKLVFDYTGVEEDTEAEANANFAFIMGDELVVTGEGLLQVFDVNGRLLVNQELHGVQTTVALPNAANGVYMLRLTEGKQSRVQKMVINK